MTVQTVTLNLTLCQYSNSIMAFCSYIEHNPSSKIPSNYPESLLFCSRDSCLLIVRRVFKLRRFGFKSDYFHAPFIKHGYLKPYAKLSFIQNIKCKSRFLFLVDCKPITKKLLYIMKINPFPPLYPPIRVDYERSEYRVRERSFPLGA